MKIIDPSFEFLNANDGKSILKSIEKAGRVCYKSEDKITPDSSKKFVQKILQSGHESVIEHEKIVSVNFNPLEVSVNFTPLE